jgi:hypothetical protein
MGTFHCLAAIVALGDRATVGRSGFARFLHQRLREFEALRAQYRDIHTASRRRVKRRRGYGQRQCLGVISPAQYELAAVARDIEVVHRFPVSQVLAGMIHGRLHVDVRRVNESGQCGEFLLGHVFFQVLALRERTDADRIAVGRDDGHGFANVLGGGAVHDDAGSGLEAVYRHVRRDHERAATKARHRGLERGKRS